MSFTDLERRVIWDALAQVNGQRWLESVRPTREDVAKYLRRLRRELLIAKKGHHNAHILSRFLSPLGEGMTDATQAHFEALHQLKVEAAAQLGIALELGHAQPVQDMLLEPQTNCDQLREAAKAALDRVQRFKGSPGRDRLEYYDRFTWILISICELLNLSPKLARDRTTNQPQGALVDLARLMERFLCEPFRTSSNEMLYDRLESGIKTYRRKSCNIFSR